MKPTSTFVFSAVVLFITGCGPADSGDLDTSNPRESSEDSSGTGGKADRAGGEVPGLIGGQQADEEKFDAVLKLETGCTAAKIGEHRMLTAAHCVAGTWLSSGLEESYRPGGQFEFTEANVVDEAAENSYRRATVVQTHVHPDWMDCSGEGAGCLSLEESPHPPDVAVVEVEESIEAPYAEIDTTRVEDGDPVVILGYGCEESYWGPRPDPPRLKYAETHTVGRSTLGEFEAVYDSYLVTPGASADEGTATLCPGDSGGPVFRADGTGQRIVGVNAYYLDDGALTEQSLHTRLGPRPPYQVSNWLGEIVAPPEPSTDACLVISEYVHGGSDGEYGLELYNCGDEPLELDGYSFCRLGQRGSSCSDARPLRGELPAGEVVTACGWASNPPISDRCQTETLQVDHTGKQRYVVFRDRDDDDAFDPTGDVVTDAFGPVDGELEEAYHDVVLRRCRLEPYRGRGEFDVDEFFASHPASELQNYGSPPSTAGCRP